MVRLAIWHCPAEHPIWMAAFDAAEFEDLEIIARGEADVFASGLRGRFCGLCGSCDIKVSVVPTKFRDFIEATMVMRGFQGDIDRLKRSLSQLGLFPVRRVPDAAAN